ncbi:MAG: ring-cleaving dioxygenase [Halodesulfurarchaeum sp.]|nr:ring-cleaving dioxygenase [Halodesulfurarchaeum sp.]
MELHTPGIHHVTAIAADPGVNLQFYTQTLGMRLVKRSVNQDDVSVYHLFYGDREGSPGTSLTFFPYEGATPGRAGSGQVTTVHLAIPAGAVEYWRDRLDDAGVDRDEPVERFGETVLPLRDPDGLELELVATEASGGTPPDGPVPEEHAIRGFHGVTMTIEDARGMTGLLEAMGYGRNEETAGRTRYASSGDLGAVLDLQVDPDGSRGRPGAGTVHHVAFRVTAAEQSAWRDLLSDRGLRPTEIIDRKWFESVYVRTPGGILFEFATETPGYTVDEDLESLGNELVLPDWLEDRRTEIEAGLPDLAVPAESR